MVTKDVFAVGLQILMYKIVACKQISPSNINLHIKNMMLTLG